ncbi:uncharacterized protein LOC124144517 [Haliotis rufescens]|uniref:uncharacterized protein LOC124144517 n=1 Tax=Haliotis rufescens TaxID=6454 RepID=UPI00201FAF76|nr:uncharacterized protein LOC124144517 [Haliotis rufescens]
MEIILCMFVIGLVIIIIITVCIGCYQRHHGYEAVPDTCHQPAGIRHHPPSAPSLGTYLAYQQNNTGHPQGPYRPTCTGIYQPITGQIQNPVAYQPHTMTAHRPAGYTQPYSNYSVAPPPHHAVSSTYYHNTD